MKYRPEIDGLRALAILPVVLYHAGVPGFSGGFVGVDVFFVISGYLITSIILAETAAGGFSLQSFFVRRIRRIFPALFVMMLISYPFAFILLSPSAMKEFSGSMAASTGFLANVYFLGVSGYFATAAELKPLLHNWSLAIEEQFYLLFPLTLLLTLRLGKTFQLGLFAAIALASLGLAQWQISTGDAVRAFFLLQSRAWELTIGVFAAFLITSRQGEVLQSSRALRQASLVGVALILTAVVTYDGDTPFPGAAALVPCLGAALVIVFATPGSLAREMLSWRPLVFVGLVSYSLYLWHYPLLAFTRIATETDDHWLLLNMCGVAFLIACLSWRYIETPLRELPAAKPLRILVPAALGMVLLGGLGLAGYQTDGYRDIYLAYRLDDATRANFETYRGMAQRSNLADEDCMFSSEQPNDAFESRFEDCARTHGKAVLVLGDSHSGNIYGALRQTGNFPFLVALSRGGCRPFKPKPECPYEAAIPFLEKHGRDVSQLLFHVSGSHYILDHLGKDDSPAAFIAGNPVTFSSGNISKTIQYIHSLPRGPDIVWLGPFAEARVDVSAPENFSPNRLRFSQVSLDHFAGLDAMLKAATDQDPSFRYVSLMDAFDLNPESLITGGCLTFADVDHLSGCGEQIFGPLIETAIR